MTTYLTAEGFLEDEQAGFSAGSSIDHIVVSHNVNYIWTIGNNYTIFQLFDYEKAAEWVESVRYRES